MASGADGGGGGSCRAGRVVGDYVFDRQIGLGSFSVVWRARHRTQGTEVAVKEIVMERLSRKLQESLLSEVVILKKISHPNIIALHDIIEASGRIYLILEYCRGGDLSKFIQRHGRVPEATAKCFMQQLASGLQVLRENNLIHRDLKPQNLLLSTHDDNSVLKIADFGFARSLHPRGLAETLCGSPLYMAPEIMQLQKYDAKADLWSVGAILFQLVTGKTPFTGSNQIQLLQNIMKSNELRFPSDNNSSWDCIDLCRKLLRRNPVERLTFEEFFNHPFLSQHRADESLSKTSTDMRDGFSSVECSATRFSGGSSQEDHLPILLDDESSEKNACPPMLAARSIARPIYGFSLDNKIDENLANSPSKNIGTVPRFSRPPKKQENTSYGRDYHMPTGTNVKEPVDSTIGSTVADSLEFIDQEYVIVPGPPLEMSSSSLNSFGPDNPPIRSDDLLVAYQSSSPSNVPLQISGTVIREKHATGSLYNSRYPGSETSQGSMGTVDSLEEPPSIHCITRIRSLEQFAFIITELVKQEMASGRRLEAFSLQLVILAIWKLALHACHAQAVPSSDECNGSSETPLSDGLYSQTERDFLIEVERAEELARDVRQVDDATEMPDPIEIIFQSALTFGRHGAVDDMMGHTERAMAQYGKSICLLYFILAEASSLVPNPPVSLTKSDRYRLRSYIMMISNRYGQLEATKNGSSHG